jgi:hypothetical protein
MNEQRMRLVPGLLLLLLWKSCLGATGGEPEDGTKRLVLHPVPQGVSGGELRLLPGPQEMTEGDAFPLYVKAIEALPKDLDWMKIKSWRQLPLKGLPQAEVGSVLCSLDASLPLLEQAGNCKRCNWVIDFAGNPLSDLRPLRNIVFLIALRARSQLARADYTACAATLKVGWALARHLSTSTTAVHVLAGAAVSGVLCGELELYVQQPDAPSLEAALGAMPQPFVDEEPSDLYGLDEDSRNRGRLVLRRANRHIVALQYVETLRRHAAATGQWPETLDPLRSVLPDDPVTKKPFEYRRLTKTQAVLTGAMPEGGSARDILRYELNLQQKER